MNTDDYGNCAVLVVCHNLELFSCCQQTLQLYVYRNVSKSQTICYFLLFLSKTVAKAKMTKCAAAACDSIFKHV